MLGLSASLQQRQLLSAVQLQSLRVLSLSNAELDEFCRQAQLDNPILEYAPATTCVSAAQALTPEIPQPEPPSLERHLLSQLDTHRLTPSECRLFTRLLQLLDGQGYLPFSDDELCALLQTSPAALARTLTFLRSLEPAGVGARDLPHCLLLQLVRTGSGSPLDAEIILHHLDDLAQGRLRKIAKQLHTTVAAVTRTAQLVRTLQPHPASAFCADTTVYITPDLLVFFENGILSLQMVEFESHRLQLSSVYLALARQAATESEKSYFTEMIRRARAITQSITQRRSTLLRLGQFLLQTQHGFFADGQPCRPLTMNETADALGVNVSTISRTIRGKFLQCSRGCLPLRLFFSVSAADSSTGAVSREEIKSRLAQLLQTEPAEQPFSDAALARLLQSRFDIVLSRRTIAKYRSELGIPGAYERSCRETK